MREIKGPLVWCNVENATATADSLHCYYARERGPSWNRYMGNSALCNKKLGVSEDGDGFLPADKIIPSNLNRAIACKKCLKIYDNQLTINKPNTNDNRDQI